MKNSLCPLPAISQKSFKLFDSRLKITPNLKSSGSYSPVSPHQIGLIYSPSKNIRNPSLVTKSTRLKHIGTLEANIRSRKEILTIRQHQETNLIRTTNKRIQDAIQVKRLFKTPDPLVMKINYKFDLP